jgi:hypothetical protein
MNLKVRHPMAALGLGALVATAALACIGNFIVRMMEDNGMDW